MAYKESVFAAPKSFQVSSAKVKNWVWREKPVWFKLVFVWVFVLGTMNVWCKACWFALLAVPGL